MSNQPEYLVTRLRRDLVLYPKSSQYKSLAIYRSVWKFEFYEALVKIGKRHDFRKIYYGLVRACDHEAITHSQN